MATSDRHRREPTLEIFAASFALMVLEIAYTRVLSSSSIAMSRNEPDAYAAWAFGVNGAFSVVASVASAMLVMTIGFRALILVALAIYVLGTVALRARGARSAMLRPS